MIQILQNPGFGALDELVGIIVDITEKSALVLILAWIISRLFCHRSASERHLVWFFAFVILAVLPVVPFLHPTDNSLLFEPFPTRRVHTPLPIHFTDVQTSHTLLPNLSVGQIQLAHARERSELLSPVAITPIASALLPTDAIRVVIIGWFLGAALCLLDLVFSLLKLPFLTRQTAQVTSGREFTIFNSCLPLTRIKRRVTLTIARPGFPSSVPLTWGFARPVIVIPAAAADWGDAHLRSALLHELAHIKRADWLNQVFVSTVSALYWFNPLVWSAASRMRDERESACDDYAISVGTVPSEYARHLLETAKAVGNRGYGSSQAIAMVRKCKIETRLRAILNSSTQRRQTNPAVSLVVLVAAILLTVLAAQYQLCFAANGPDGGTIVTRETGDDFGGTGYDIGDGNDAVVAPGSSATMVLPNKVTVRLIGVTDSQTTPATALRFHRLSAGEKGRTFAFELTYPLDGLTPPHDAGSKQNESPSEAVANFQRALHEYNEQCAAFYKNQQNIVPSILYQYIPNDHLNEEYPAVQSINVGGSTVTEKQEYSEAFKASRHVARLRVAVAAGPFINIAKLPNRPSTSNGRSYPNVLLASTFSPALSKPDGESEVTITDNLASKHSAHAFTDFDRKLVCFSATGTCLGDYELHQKSFSGDLTFTDSVSIPNSILKKTNTLDFVARPYYWVEFDNVKLNQRDAGPFVSP